MDDVTQVIASEVFGSLHLSKNYMFYDGTCGAVGSLLFANLLPSTIYQIFANGNDCYGPACFGYTHVLIAFLCACATGAALVVSVRTASLYAQIGGAVVLQLH